MTRKKLFVANWKMHFTVVKAIQFLQKFREQVGNSSAEIVLCTPFTALSALRYEINKKVKATREKGEFSMQHIRLGAQNLYPKTEGAYTGEISPMMVKELADYVLIGHSERRKLFHETDAVIHDKLVAAHTVGLIPILCLCAVVSQKKELVNAFTEHKLEIQLKSFVTGLHFDAGQQLVIAYEPVASIGTGNAADPNEIQRIIHFIRRQLDQQFGSKIAATTRLLYGGSVISKNAKLYIDQPDIDGLLVGSASLDADEFARIIQVQ